MSERKNKIGLDSPLAGVARFDADTIAELKELIVKLAESEDRAGALEQNELSGMVTFLESFESDAVESKFILHHVTKSVVENNPERLMCWAIVYMLRNSKIPSDHLQREVQKLMKKKPH